MVARIVGFILLSSLIAMGTRMWDWTISPEVATQIGLNQVNGTNSDAAIVRTYQAYNGLLDLLTGFAILVLFFLFFWSKIMNSFKNNKPGRILPFVLLVFLSPVFSSGCRTPYDKPEYESIDTNETAFVIPLEGSTTDQVAFNSVEQLNKHKVATKRIQITHRWNQTGRWAQSGEWIATLRVIKVSRTPTTREWNAQKDKGTGVKDEAIWAESSDSVGFSTGISITAMIAEDNTAKFLYSYNGQSLAQVMDSEVRARLQTRLAEFSAGFVMDKLRDQKAQMINYVREDVIQFFEKKGISITTIGQFGGFTYENKEIQDSIDKVFIAQQEKMIAKALLDAQKDKNARLEQEGTGEASKVKEIAKGKREALITEAEGRAQAINAIAEATKKAGQDPLFLEIRKLEVQQEQIKQWDGKYPLYMMSMGTGTSGLLINMPATLPSR